MLTFVSCFSGIEAASVAWRPLGFRCVATAEIEPFPAAVLSHHYPSVPNLGDVLADDFLNRIAALGPDAIAGGPPCQDFSVAGLRAGIHGHRGNLTFRWVQIIHASNARFALTENVPGWLSANAGHAFGAFLAGLVGHDTALVPPKDCGGRWTNAGMVAGPLGRAAWRILDAQFFGLAQRRKRVFVVFCPGDRDDPAAVLFEPASLRGYPAPGREARERVAGSLTGGSGKRGWSGDNGAGQGAELIAMALNAHGGSGRLDWESETFVADYAPALSKSNPYGDHESREGLLVASAYRTSGNCGAWDSGDRVDALNTFTDPNSHIVHSLRADGFDASEDGTGRGTPLVPIDMRQASRGAKLTNNRAHGSGGAPGHGVGDDGDPAFTVSERGQAIAGSAVRRLTPRECERLQGFPDDYTLIPWRNGMASDGPRYRALGNSMAVPVMAWIGRRIAAEAARA